MISDRASPGVPAAPRQCHRRECPSVRTPRSPRLGYGGRAFLPACARERRSPCPVADRRGHRDRFSDRRRGFESSPVSRLPILRASGLLVGTGIRPSAASAEKASIPAPIMAATGRKTVPRIKSPVVPHPSTSLPLHYSRSAGENLATFVSLLAGRRVRVPGNPAPIAVSLDGVDCAETKAKCILSGLPQTRHMIMVRQFFNRRLRPKRERILRPRSSGVVHVQGFHSRTRNAVHRRRLG